MNKKTMIRFKVTHPLYGKDKDFESWNALVERTFEIAADQAQFKLKIAHRSLTLAFVDAMLNGYEEYEITPIKKNTGKKSSKIKRDTPKLTSL